MSRPNRRRAPNSSSWQIAALEPRLMLAADAGAAVAQETGANPSAMEGPAAAESSQQLVIDAAAPQTLVFIDEAVAELGQWNDLMARDDVDVVLINRTEDAIDQMSRVVGSHSELKSIHIISHGSAGQIQFSGQTLDAQMLREASSKLQQWQSAMAPGADILLLGCDIAADSSGQSLVKTLANLTDADVAASTDRTGELESGGDWDLEFCSGTIDQTIVLSRNDRESFVGVLDVTITARGQTGEEQFELLINDEVVASYSATTDTRDYRYQTLANVQADDVKVRFTNDRYDRVNNIDRNLFVDSIRLNSQVVTTNSPTVFSNGTWRREDGIIDGFGRGNALHTNGFFHYGQQTESPDGDLVVRARGQEGGERFTVSIDGESVGTFTVTDQFADYAIDGVAPLSIEDVRVDFINDRYEPENGIDFNLFVDSVTVKGETFQTEADDVFASGVWVRGEGISSGFLNTEKLSSTGYFQFGAATTGNQNIVDTDFGTDGESDSVGLSGGFIAVVSNTGKFATAGTREVRVFNADGSADTTFGDAGVVDMRSVITAVDLDRSYETFDIDATDDGGWLITGRGFAFDPSNSTNGVLLTKLNSQGQIDSNFAGGLRQDLPIATGFNDPMVPKTTIDPANGNITIVGEQFSNYNATRPDGIVAVRLRANGDTDLTFGDGGQTLVAADEFSSSGQLVVQGAETLAGGETIYIVSSSGTLSSVKLRADGQLDQQYGNNGVASLTPPGILIDHEYAVDSDGRVAFAVETPLTRSVSEERFLIIYQFDAAGSLDAGFGSQGRIELNQLYDVGADSPRAFDGQGQFAIEALPGNRWVISQNENSQFSGTPQRGTLVATVSDTGSLDGSFSDDGVAFADVSTFFGDIVSTGDSVLALSSSTGQTFTRYQFVSRWIV